jgi:L-aspartate oxidase
MKKYLGPKRYLTQFDTWRMPHVYCGVLVIGSGVGGLRAALAAARHAKVLLVSKQDAEDSNTNKAQGGVAAAVSKDDSFESHIADTLAVGQGLCDPAVVDSVVREAPGRIAELVEMGAQFDRSADGFTLGLEGGHSLPRIVHARGDSTGAEIEETLLRQVRANPDIQLVDHAYVVDLVTGEEGCLGGIVYDKRWGMILIWGRRVVLATGGAGQLYRETTNPDVATADGLAIAYRCGAELRDLEFIQFHPTTLYIAGAARALVSETLRGYGAVLRNRDGEAFMPRYHPDKDLAPRDAVCRAIVEEMRRTGATHVYLDLTHLESEHVLKRFPTLSGLCADFDMDISKDLIPVRPSAHYSMGGVTVDPMGATTVPRLFACGEVSCTGLHGANRLGSNSLLEGMVYGARAGERAGREAAREAGVGPVEPAPVRIRSDLAPARRAEINLLDMRNSLRSLMARNVGIERTRAELADAEKSIDFWCSYIMEQGFHNPEGWELQNMLAVAKLTTVGALHREETRGAHYRTDFPKPDDGRWRAHVTLSREEGLRVVPARGS